MKPRYIIIIALAVFTSRCTHLRQVQSFDEINKVAAGKPARVTLTDGRVLSGKGLQMATDSTSWLDSTTGRKQSIVTTEIDKVVIKKRGRGALEGLGMGVLAGAVIGFALGDDPPCEPYPNDLFGIGQSLCEGFRLSAGEKALAGAGGGGLWGMIIGAAVGSKDKFVLHENKIEDK
jgi:hypothetical protein